MYILFIIYLYKEYCVYNVFVKKLSEIKQKVSFNISLVFFPNFHYLQTMSNSRLKLPKIFLPEQIQLPLSIFKGKV